MKYARGFTLIEMAMVLLIVGLMVGGLLGPLSVQVQSRRISETQKALEEIKEALLGYAVIHGALPCPTTQANPASPFYGEPDPVCPGVEGYLPWKVLGVPEVDAWGTRRTTAAPLWPGYWRYRVDTTFVVNNFNVGAAPSNSLVVLNNAGQAVTTNVPNSKDTPVAIIYSTGPNLQPDGANAAYNRFYQQDVETQQDASGNPFDDITVWITPSALYSRMLAAGVLPR